MQDKQVMCSYFGSHDSVPITSSTEIRTTPSGSTVAVCDLKLLGTAHVASLLLQLVY